MKSKGHTQTETGKEKEKYHNDTMVIAVLNFLLC
jgi:hypothetical protein